MTEKLKAIMKEIEGILEKHDICGAVILQDEDDLEFLYKLEASWNCITQDEHGLRIKAALATGPESEKEKLRLSASVAMGFHSFGGVMTDDMARIIRMLSSKGVEITTVMRRK